MHERERVFSNCLRQRVLLLLRAGVDDLLHDAASVLVLGDRLAVLHERVVNELLVLGPPAGEHLEDDVVAVDVVAQSDQLLLQELSHHVDF